MTETKRRSPGKSNPAGAAAYTAALIAAGGIKLTVRLSPLATAALLAIEKETGKTRREVVEDALLAHGEGFRQ